MVKMKDGYLFIWKNTAVIQLQKGELFEGELYFLFSIIK
jgi:hypothetical protein